MFSNNEPYHYEIAFKNLLDLWKKGTIVNYLLNACISYRARPNDHQSTVRGTFLDQLGPQLIHTIFISQFKYFHM